MNRARRGERLDGSLSAAPRAAPSLSPQDPNGALRLAAYQEICERIVSSSAPATLAHSLLLPQRAEAGPAWFRPLSLRPCRSAARAAHAHACCTHFAAVDQACLPCSPPQTLNPYCLVPQVSENVFSQYIYKTLPTHSHLWMFKKNFCKHMALSGASGAHFSTPVMCHCMMMRRDSHGHDLAHA